MKKDRGGFAAGVLHAIDGVLVVPAPAECDDRALRAMKTGVLAAAHAASARGVVIDVARLEFLDTVMFATLADTARTLGLLGARTVFVGFQPGVVSALMDLDVACDALCCAASLEDALAVLRPAPGPDAEPDVEPDELQEEGARDRDGEAAPGAAGDAGVADF